MKYRNRDVIIFDLDGTLVDSMSKYAEIFAELLAKRLDLSYLKAKDSFLQNAGIELVDQFKSAAPNFADPLLIESLVQEFWARASRTKPQLYQNVTITLETLQNRGNAVFVSSSMREDLVQKQLQLTGLSNLVIYGFGYDEENPYHKKGPGHFRAVANYLEIEEASLKRRALFVGDGQYDMRIARDFGILGIGVLTLNGRGQMTSAGASFVVDNIANIIDLI